MNQNYLFIYLQCGVILITLLLFSLKFNPKSKVNYFVYLLLFMSAISIMNEQKRLSQPKSQKIPSQNNISNNNITSVFDTQIEKISHAKLPIMDEIEKYKFKLQNSNQEFSRYVLYFGESYEGKRQFFKNYAHFLQQHNHPVIFHQLTYQLRYDSDIYQIFEKNTYEEVKQLILSLNQQNKKPNIILYNAEYLFNNDICITCKNLIDLYFDTKIQITFITNNQNLKYKYDLRKIFILDEKIFEILELRRFQLFDFETYLFKSDLKFNKIISIQEYESCKKTIDINWDLIEQFFDSNTQSFQSKIFKLEFCQQYLDHKIEYLINNNHIYKLLQKIYQISYNKQTNEYYEQPVNYNLLKEDFDPKILDLTIDFGIQKGFIIMQDGFCKINGKYIYQYFNRIDQEKQA